MSVAELIRYDHLDVCIMTFDGTTHAAYETGLHTSWGAFAQHPVPTARSPIRALLWGQVPHILAIDATEGRPLPVRGGPQSSDLRCPPAQPAACSAAGPGQRHRRAVGFDP